MRQKNSVRIFCIGFGEVNERNTFISPRTFVNKTKKVKNFAPGEELEKRIEQKLTVLVDQKTGTA